MEETTDGSIPATPDPLTGPSGAAGPAERSSLSRRGLDLLAALRNEAAAEEGLSAQRRCPPRANGQRSAEPATPDQAPLKTPLQTAFVVAADEAIDVEPAVISLARQLACSGRGGQPDGATGVGVLMLDPLGASLRLLAPRSGATGIPVVAGPQFRVANRSEWPVLMSRLNGQAASLLVLDLTGRQHRLMPPDSSQATPTIVVVTSADTPGRLAGYRKIKELDRDGAGTIGLFFVEPSAPAADGSAGRDQTGSVDAAGPLANRAQAAFARLADIAGQFLARRLIFFGSASEPPGPTGPPTATNPVCKPVIVVEPLGQRPALNGHENRAELTRWLIDHSTPMACDALAEHEALKPPRRPLAVLPVERWPRDELEMARLLADHIETIGGGLTVILFRPPADPAAVLAVQRASAAGGVAGDRPEGGSDGGAALVLVRPVSDDGDAYAALASLLDCHDWATAHWALLRSACPQAGLPEQPRTKLVLAAEKLDGPVLRVLTRLTAASGRGEAALPLRALHLLQVQLPPADSDQPPQTGLVAQPVTTNFRRV